MWHGHASIFERISKALHDQYDGIVERPLPERWVDLINYLNEKERMQREPPQPETARRRNRSRSN
jgi:hypothetical protein